MFKEEPKEFKKAPSASNTIRNRFEKKANLDLSNVKVIYESSLPKKHHAKACTDGENIHLKAGCNDSLEHEFVHVVQQRLGRVQVTGYRNGAPVNLDPKLENEAAQGICNVGKEVPSTKKIWQFDPGTEPPITVPDDFILYSSIEHGDYRTGFFKETPDFSKNSDTYMYLIDRSAKKIGHVQMVYIIDIAGNKGELTLHTMNNGEANVGIAKLLFPEALKFLGGFRDRISIIEMRPAPGAATKSVASLLAQKLGKSEEFEHAQDLRANRSKTMEPPWEPRPQWQKDVYKWDSRMSEEHKFDLLSLIHSEYADDIEVSATMTMIKRFTSDDIEGCKTYMNDMTTLIIRDFIVHEDQWERNPFSRPGDQNLIKRLIKTNTRLLKNFDFIKPRVLKFEATEKRLDECMIMLPLSMPLREKEEYEQEIDALIIDLNSQIQQLKFPIMSAQTNALDFYIIILDYSNVSNLTSPNLSSIKLKGRALDMLL